MLKSIGSSLAAAGMLVLAADGAGAQAWIGQIAGEMAAQGAAAQKEHACMTGTPLPDAEIAEARAPALAGMRGYFADAKAGTPFGERFHLDKKTLWTGGGSSAGAAQLAGRQDALARAAAVLDAEPVGFVRGGDGRSAVGQWIARDAAGKALGTYTVGFLRKAGIWRLSTLTQTVPGAYIDPVVQYCHAPGDVMPYRLTNTRTVRETAEKRLAKAEARATAAAARASAAGAAPDTRTRAADLARKRDKLREDVAKARTDEARALADSSAAEAAKAAAMAALGR